MIDPNLSADRVDIAIVGAGMVGAALALALRNSGYSVLLLDGQAQSSLCAQHPLPDALAGFDSRVSALSPASQAFLASVGGWSQTMKNHSCAYRRMMVWDELGTGRIEFDAGDVYREQLGYIVENRTLVGVLHRQLASATHVTRRFGQAATSFTRDPGGYRLQIDGGECWQAAVLVAADGATSRVRQWAGIPGREWDYEHQAIVATVRMGQPHGHCARQRFSEDGPVALLPLVDAEASHCFNSLVWSLVPARANRMMALSEREFAHELECQFELDPGAVTAISARQCLPLRQRHAKNYVQDAVVLVGDAAHTIHPLAGQGVNLGFKDVQTLAALWQHGADKGLPANDPVLLQRYQRERKGDNLLMMAAMEGFKRLFGEAHPMVRMARNVGMDWFNRQPLLKEWLMRQAMGL